MSRARELLRSVKNLSILRELAKTQGGLDSVGDLVDNFIDSEAMAVCLQRFKALPGGREMVEQAGMSDVTQGRGVCRRCRMFCGLPLSSHFPIRMRGNLLKMGYEILAGKSQQWLPRESRRGRDGLCRGQQQLCGPWVC